MVFNKIAGPYDNFSTVPGGTPSASGKGAGAVKGSGVGGGQKPSSGISAIQQKYPAATNAISLMQKTLGDLSSSISLKLSNKNSTDPNIAKRKQLAAAIRGTQAGRELQSTDDGVWNQNTENALKALQQYVNVSYPNENVGIENLHTQKIPIQFMSSQQQISQIVSNNLRIIAKVFALEGDTRFLENTITTSEVLDQLPKTYNEAKDFANTGPIPIKVADLGRLIDAKNAVGAGFMQPGTSNPANLQVFKETSGQSEFKIGDIKAQDVMDFVTQGGKAIGSVQDFISQEAKRIIPEIMNRTSHGSTSASQQNITTQTINKELFDSFEKFLQININSEFSKEFVNNFYTKILSTLIFAPFQKDPTFLQQNAGIINQLINFFQQNRLDQASGKPFFYNDAAEAFIKTIKQDPNKLYNLPGASNFFAAKQNERASGGSSWTYSNYKLLVEMFVNRSQDQLRRAKGESSAKAAALINNIIKEAQEPPPASTESSKLSVPIKQTYVRLAKELEAQLMKLRSEIIKRFNAKFGQMDEERLNGMSVPDSYLQSLGEKMREGQSLAAERQRTQQMQGSQGRQGQGQGQAARAYGREGNRGYGDSGATQGPPNVNRPPIGAQLFLDQVSRWANVTGEGVELDGNWPKALQLTQFGRETTIQQIRAVFETSKEAVDFVTSIYRMLGPALNNWSKALMNELASGRITSRDTVEDMLLRANEYRVKWANALKLAASKFNIPPKPRR